MKIGLLGLIVGDLTDVTYNTIRFASELGFHGVGAHLTVPAETISSETAARAKGVIADQGLDFLQLWGQSYPSLISPDAHVRAAGIAQVREIVKLAAKLGVSAGVRPTSLSPSGDWSPHPDNFSDASEENFVTSLNEIVKTARDEGVRIILEFHLTTVLNTPQRIRRVIERTDPRCVRVNLDPCNLIGDLQTAYHPAQIIHALFDELRPYVDTVHVKDYYLEDRFVLHVAETVIGTGLMDFETVLKCAYQNAPNGYVVIEHLPKNLIGLAKQNLTEKIRAMSIPLG